MSTPIYQEVSIQASAQQIYDALTRSDQFSDWTGGAPATMDAVEGGAIEGRTIELMPASASCRPGG